MKAIELIKKINRERNKKTKIIKNIIASFKLVKKSKLEIKNIKKIAIIMHNVGIGDLIVSSGFFRVLKKSGFEIYIITNKEISDIIERNPYIEKIIYIRKNTPIKKQLNKNNDLKIDLLIDPFWENDIATLLPKFEIIKSIKPRYCVGLNKEKKYRVYDFSIDYKKYKSHVKEKFIALLDFLEIKDKNINYDVFISEEKYKKAINILEERKHSILISLCPFASKMNRSLSIEKTNIILNELNKIHGVLVILCGTPSSLSKIDEFDNVIKPESNQISDIIPYINLSNLVVSVDTSIVHLSNALNKNLISIYSSEVNENFIHDYVWAPGYENAIQIIAPNNSAQNIDPYILVNKIKAQLNTSTLSKDSHDMSHSLLQDNLTQH